MSVGKPNAATALALMEEAEMSGAIRHYGKSKEWVISIVQRARDCPEGDCSWCSCHGCFKCGCPASHPM